MCGVQVVEEREDKFEVDPDWVMPQLMGLVPDGGRLDQEVLRLDNTYFDAFNTSNTASVWPIQNARCHVIHAVTSTPPGQRPPPTKSAPSAHTPRAYPPGPAASAHLPSSETANHLAGAMIISASSSTWPKSGMTYLLDSAY